MIRQFALIVAILAVLAVPLAGASYTVTHITTQVTLNVNTTARVSETFTVYITNTSIAQYQADRSALNLTLSNWQSTIGTVLTQHIINPRTGVYDFKLYPGPLTTSITGQQYADVVITYGVKNVTSVRELAPRVFSYLLNNGVFNFEHSTNGQTLNPNTTLTIVLPHTATITNVYPPPDFPALSGSNFANITVLSWYYQEPLSKFALSFTTQQSIPDEVLSFFSAAYLFFGFFTYVIIILVVFFFILYTYLKIEK